MRTARRKPRLLKDDDIIFFARCQYKIKKGEKNMLDKLEIAFNALEVVMWGIVIWLTVRKR